MRLLLIVGFVVPLLTACAFIQPAPKPEGASRVPPGVTVAGTPVGGLDRSQIEATLAAMAPTKNTSPRNAKFDDNGEITPGQAGKVIDVTATVAAAFAASPNSAVSPVYREFAPWITTEVLRQAKKVGSYQTVIMDSGSGRMSNIILTVKLINNTVLEPGEEFSFNSRTGEPTADRGFKPAPVIVDGRMEQDLGGGMCQVSSTLYNAVLDAGLEVVERHPHSQPVSYVPSGRDATTYTDKDLRFVNSARRTLAIRAFVAEKNVVVDFWALSY